MTQTLANNITKKVQKPHDFEIYVSDSFSKEGSLIPDVYPVSQISIVKAPNKLAYAKLVVSDGSVASQDFPISNAEEFKPGMYVTIKMGDIVDKRVAFKGIIVKQGIKIKKGKNSVLTVDCRDIAVQMTTNKNSRYFAEKTTDSDAFLELIGRYKDLGNDLVEIAGEHEGLVQYDCTDWDFILQRASLTGQLVYTHNGVFKTVTPTVNSQADYTLEYGDNVEEFEAEIDIKTQYSSVKLNVWDSSKQEVLEEEASSVTSVEIESPGNLSNTELSNILNKDGLEIDYQGVLIAEKQKSLVEAELIKSKLARVRGRVSFVESTVIEPCSTIELKGVGDRYNGLTYVTGVRYEFGGGVWKTDLQFGLHRNWFEGKALNSYHTDYLAPSMSGLYIGVVTRVDDETGEDRIKVRIPLIDDKSEGVWAKMSRQDAGEHRGTFFLPEVEDEVLISFLNNDPQYPMIIGMLNSSAKPAPIMAKDKDNLKGYYSKIGSRIEFDDEKRILKIQTVNSDEDLKQLRSSEPDLEKNNTILIDDKKGTIKIQDKNGNYIELSDKQVHIFGEKKILLKSKEVKIEASSKLDIKSGGTKMKSDQVTEIKGAILKLN